MTPDANQQQTQIAQPTPSAVSAEGVTAYFSSGLYWKKGRGLRSTEPVALELTKDSLTMYGNDDRQVFHVPPSTVQARFTRIGMLKLTINGELYTLFTNSGLWSRLSPALKTRLAGSTATSGGVSGMGLVAASTGTFMGVAESNVTGNALPGMLGGVAGAAVHGAAVHRDDKLMERWRTSFQQAGIPTTGKSQQLLMAFAFGGIFFLLLMLTVLISYLLQKR